MAHLMEHSIPPQKTTAEDYATCPTCQGRCWIVRNLASMQNDLLTLHLIKTCPQCSGTGRVSAPEWFNRDRGNTTDDSASANHRP